MTKMRIEIMTKRNVEIRVKLQQTRIRNIKKGSTKMMSVRARGGNKMRILMQIKKTVKIIRRKIKRDVVANTILKMEKIAKVEKIAKGAVKKIERGVLKRIEKEVLRIAKKKENKAKRIVKKR